MFLNGSIRVIYRAAIPLIASQTSFDLVMFLVRGLCWLVLRRALLPCSFRLADLGRDGTRFFVIHSMTLCHPLYVIHYMHSVTFLKIFYDYGPLSVRYPPVSACCDKLGQSLAPFVVFLSVRCC